MLNATKLGLSGGIWWALFMFIATLISVYTGYAADFLHVMGSIYPGYQVSGGGAFVGLIYGFIDGFISLFLLAWLYNKLEV